jgi:hypothetical protein
VVVEKADGKGLKSGRRNAAASTPNKAPRLEEDVVEVAGDDVLQKVLPPPVKGGRSSRHRSSDTNKPVELQDDVTGSAALEGEGSKHDSPPTWGEDFDPVAFVAENLKGHSTRLEALSLEELRKLAVGSGLKCLALNQMVFNRQEKEASLKLEKEVGAAKEELEKELTSQLAKSQADFSKSLGKEKKKNSALRKEKRNLLTARNAAIVALVKIWRDVTKRDDEMSALNAAAERLNGDLKELEAENDELKEGMAGQFVAGF